MPTATLDEFKHRGERTPPVGASAPLAALWWARRGEWETAHGLVQDAPGWEAAWVHAYLHRCEGDLSNAGYWYRRAGKAPGRGALDGEWDAIAAALLAGPA